MARIRTHVHVDATDHTVTVSLQFATGIELTDPDMVQAVLAANHPMLPDAVRGELRRTGHDVDDATVEILAADLAAGDTRAATVPPASPGCDPRPPRTPPTAGCARRSRPPRRR